MPEQLKHDPSADTPSEVERVRASLPESCQRDFDALRKEIMDFCAEHNIPPTFFRYRDFLKVSLNNLSLSELEDLNILFIRLKFLVEQKKPMTEIDAMRQEVLDFCALHHILPKSLTDRDALRFSTRDLSLSTLQHLAFLLERLGNKF